jgi:hypothetical protein
MPTIILKKTCRYTEGMLVNTIERSFSFHGSAVDVSFIATINQKLHNIRYAQGSNMVAFGLDAKHHYSAGLNHKCQKHNEEDVVVAILDVMETMGWSFKFQYDTENLSGSAGTANEMFIFQQPLVSASAYCTVYDN